jgi:hypothetical protein
MLQEDRMGEAQWACKKCKGKFETMADFKYHRCELVPFERKPADEKPASTAKRLVDER